MIDFDKCLIVFLVVISCLVFGFVVCVGIEVEGSHEKNIKNDESFNMTEINNNLLLNVLLLKNLKEQSK